ncbi:unnamed protein product, partial [Sphacelaria rigidula]
MTTACKIVSPLPPRTPFIVPCYTWKLYVTMPFIHIHMDLITISTYAELASIRILHYPTRIAGIEQFSPPHTIRGTFVSLVLRHFRFMLSRSSGSLSLAHVFPAVILKSNP